MQIVIRGFFSYNPTEFERIWKENWEKTTQLHEVRAKLAEAFTQYYIKCVRSFTSLKVLLPQCKNTLLQCIQSISV